MRAGMRLAQTHLTPTIARFSDSQGTTKLAKSAWRSNRTEDWSDSRWEEKKNRSLGRRDQFFRSGLRDRAYTSARTPVRIEANARVPTKGRIATEATREIQGRKRFALR